MPSPAEHFTRKQRIDRALSAAGWRGVPLAAWLAGQRTAADAVEEYPNVIEQAKRYARSFAEGVF